MAKRPDESIAFEGQLDKIVTVPKHAITKAHEAHKAASKAKAVRPGPKPKKRTLPPA